MNPDTTLFFLKVFFYITAIWFVATFKREFESYKKNGVGNTTFLPALGVTIAAVIFFIRDVFGHLPFFVGIVLIIFFVYFVIRWRP